MLMMMTARIDWFLASWLCWEEEKWEKIDVRVGLYELRLTPRARRARVLTRLC